MAKPLHSSPIPARSVGKRADVGEAGAGLLGFEAVPVQRELWRLLQASKGGVPLYENAAIEVPRRAGKTEGLLSLAVGRCSTHEDYQVAYAAQSGIKSRARFLGLHRRLGRHGAGGWTAYRSRGEEAINWDNGSSLLFYAPKAENFRGDAIDWLILDEAQETDQEDAEELLGSVLPIFDTREGPQLTVAGTAGKYRSGLLWDALENGRAGKWGILEYAAREGFDLNDEARWLDVHPGPAGVSARRAMEVLRKRRATMSDEMFGREYLGIWPLAVGSSAFALDDWQRLGGEQPEQPRRFGIGFDVPPLGGRPSVAVAWRDEEGLAWVEVVGESTADAIAALARRYRVPLGFDTAGVDTLALADEIARRHRNMVKLRGLTTAEFATSCVTLDAAVRAGRLRHTRQPQLSEAIEVATRRSIRDGGWAWGRAKSSGSIAPLVAATVALRMYDDLPVRREMKVITAASAAS